MISGPKVIPHLMGMAMTANASKVDGKPNIKKSGGMWSCGTGVFDTYQDWTMVAAFAGWVSLRSPGFT